MGIHPPDAPSVISPFLSVWGEPDALAVTPTWGEEGLLSVSLPSSIPLVGGRVFLPVVVRSLFSLLVGRKDGWSGGRVSERSLMRFYNEVSSRQSR